MEAITGAEDVLSAVPATTKAGSRRRSHLHVRTLGAVALGGALGTPARVEISRVVPSGPGFPWETLLVNVVGSFLLGMVAALLIERAGPNGYLGPIVASGFCGSFTTLSTFAVEVDLQLRSGDVAAGLGYAGVSVLCGFAAVALGLGAARLLSRRKAVDL